MVAYSFNASSIKTARLATEIVTAGLPAPLGVTHDAGVVGRVRVDFSSALDAGQQTTLSNTVAAHDAAETLPEAMTRKIKSLDLACRTYIEDDDKYPPARQRTLTYLLADARDTGKTNRMAYIEPLWTWIDSIFNLFYSKRDEIVACGSVAAVDAVTWDLTTFDATDPAISIEAARAIPD